MRSFPDSAEIKARANSPMPDAVIARGRYIVGALAISGAFLFFGMAEPASAHTRSSTIPKSTKPTTTTAPTPARTAVDSAHVHTIEKGETLSSIAARYGVSVPSLATVNGINNYNLIIAGQELLIPVAGSASPAPTVKVTAPASAKAKTPKPVTVSVGASSAGQNLPTELRNSSRATLAPQFDQAAAAYGVPAELLKALTYQESGWNNKMVSSTGAVGVGQLMPATVEFINTQLLTKPLDPNVPAQNIRMSAAFLSYLLSETNGDQTLAAAAYYQGLGAVRNIGLYDDTKQYIQSIQALRANWF